MNERDWSRRVTDCARVFGWRYAHFRPARTAKGWRTAMEGAPGFPDLVLLRPPRLILAELKVHPETQHAGRPNAEQVAWLALFAQVPAVEASVWRPEDWERVYATLAKESRP